MMPIYFTVRVAYQFSLLPRQVLLILCLFQICDYCVCFVATHRVEVAFLIVSGDHRSYHCHLVVILWSLFGWKAFLFQFQTIVLVLFSHLLNDLVIRETCQHHAICSWWHGEVRPFLHPVLSKCLGSNAFCHTGLF